MSVKSIQPSELSELSDSEILNLRFKNIKLNINESEVSQYRDQLYSELDSKGLLFRPQIFLGDEWFSPEGMNAISVPFYLSHSRLKALEKTLMLEVEGGNAEWFMKLLRHEAGHCFDHCYQFSTSKKWTKVFGSPNKDYHPETYRPLPFSKSYVKHLDRWYAQAHPDEDFAETFAVWLNPKSNWKKEYQKWPVALAKLNYMESLSVVSTAMKNKSESGRLPFNVKNLTSTLESYYQKRKRENADEYPDFYDADLKKIFNGDLTLSKRELLAANFMKRHRKTIVTTVAWATGERKFTIDSFVRRLTDRALGLELRLGKTEMQTTMEVASFLTSLVKNYLFTGKFKREV
jgi:hypothetical protein